MKKIPCSYDKCSDRRAHWCAPHINRPHQMIEVPDDHTGPMYCSFECAAYAGAFKMNNREEKPEKVS